MVAKWSRLSIAIAVAAFLAFQPTVVLASHQANCSEYSFIPHQNGYVSDSWINHRYGVRANFDDQGLDLCLNPRPGEGSASTAWVAIQGPPVPLGVEYGNIVQVGHGRCRPIAGGGCNGNMQDGWAWGRWSGSSGCAGMSNKAPTGVWFGVWSGGGTYSVVEDGDNDITATTPSVQATIFNICWANQTVAVFGETHDFGDALGGFPANHFQFTFKQFKTSAAGGWMTLPNACNARFQAPDPPFECLANPNGALELWTNR
jgi:hypothetical protein